MTASTQTLKNDDATSVGTLVVHNITSPATGFIGISALATVSGGTATDVSTSNPLPISDAGGSLTVDNAALAVTGGGAEATALRVTLANDSTGTVTANLSAVDNAVLDSIDAALAGTLTVGSHAVTNAGTFAVQVDGDALTALQLIDDAVYTDATGTPSKGIAVMGTDGTNPQLLSVDTSGHAQVDVLSVTGTVTVDASGTAVPVTDNGGSLTVDNSTLSVTGGGTEATALRVTLANDSTGTVTANLSAVDNAVLDDIAARTSDPTVIVDDAAFTPGTTSVSMVGFEFDDTTPDSVNEGDGGAARMSANRNQYIQLRDGAGNERGANVNASNSLEVHITGNDVATGGTSSTDDGAFTAGSGSGTPAMGFFSTDTVDSGDVGVLAMDASRRLLVSIEADNAGIGGGTQYAVDTALGATPTGTLAVAIRDDALSALTPVEGDAVGLRVDANGALWTIPSGTVTVDGSGVTQPISAASLPLPTGAATAANQSTANTSLSNVDTNTTDLPNVIGTDGTAGPTKSVSIAGTESGGNLQEIRVDADGHPQVDILSSVALDVSAATVTVDLGANNDVTIDGSSIVHLEDAVHTTGDAGVMSLAVRNDTLAALAGTDGDYAPLQVNASGAVYVAHDGDVAVTNAGTFAVQVDGDALTALQLIDDAVYTDATGTPSKGIAVMGTDGTNPQLLSVDTSGHAQVDVLSVTGTVTVDASGTAVPVTDNGGSLTVDNSTLSVTGGGTEATALRVTLANDSTGVVSVDDGGSSLTIDGTVTADLGAVDNAVLDDIAARTSDPTVIVDDAAFTPGTTSVSMVGFEFDDTTPDSVNEGDGGAARMSANRNQYVQLRDGAGNERGANVNASNSLEVHITGNDVATGGTSSTDDGAFTAGSGSGTPAMGFFSTDTVDSGDVGVLAMDASRRLLVSIEADNAGIGGGTQYAVDTALGATPTGTLAVAIRDDALSALTPVEGDAVGLRVDANGALWTIPSGTVTVDGSGVTQPISAASLPLPTGAATAANQSTANTSLSNVDTNTTDLPNVIGTDGTAGPTKSVSIAGTESGGNLQEIRVDADGHPQVDILSSVALDVSAATVTVDLGANNDVTIDGSSIVHLEDAVHTTGDAGVMSLAVRNDTLAALAGTDGDYAPLQVNASGAVYVAHDGDVTIADGGNSITVDNAALSVTGGGVEASALRVTLASDSTGVLSIDDNGSTISVDDGAGSLTVDNAALSVTGGGVEASALRVTIANDSTGVVTVDDGGSTLSIDDGAGSLTVDNATLSTTGGGTEASALRVTLANDSTGLVSVDDNGGSLTVDASQLDIDDLAATADNVGAALMTNVIHNGTTALTPKFAKIDAATSGDNTLVAAVTSKKIRVLQVFMVANGDVDVRFEDGAAGTALTGQMDLTTNSGFVLPFSPVGWFETSANTLLNLELSGAVSVDGCLTYVEV